MYLSESITNIATALAKAQSEFQPAKKDATNPFLKNNYATLDSIIESVRQPLSKNGLSFVQLVDTEQDKTTLTTMLIHESGEYYSCCVELPQLPPMKGVNELQLFGISLTYIKRYTLSTMLGVSNDTDNDGTAPIAKQLEEKQQKIENPSELILTFGKHKGKTLDAIWNEDGGPGYIKWVMANANDDYVKQAASQFMQEKEKPPVQINKEAAQKPEKENEPVAIQQRQLIKNLFATCFDLDIKATTFLDTINAKLAAKGNRKLHEMGPVEAKSVIDAFLKYKKTLDKKEEGVRNE